MSLSNTLSDILDDVKNIDTKDIVTENIEINSIEINNVPISIERFPKETLDKINNMFNLIILQSNINNLSKVDYALANEVFTMLPDISTNVEKAKLTTNPSMINKEILEKVFNTNIKNKISVDIYDKLFELKSLIEQNLEKFNEIYKYIESFNQLIETKVSSFREIPPLVIEYNQFTNNENKNYNLFTDKIQDIIYLDDSKMEYEKYSNTLINKYNKLYNDETLKELSTIYNYFNLSEISLSLFITSVNEILNLLRQKEIELKNYVSGLNAINSDRDNVQLNSDTIDFINGHNGIAQTLEYLNKIYSIIKVEDNCFTKVVDLITFLD